MASKSTKHKKEEVSLTLDAITAVLEDHRQSLSAEFKASFTTLDSKLDQIRLTVEDHGQRLSSLELAADDVSQRVQDLESICTALQEDNTKLKAKVTDLESRSRRQNVRILGIPESTESGRPTEFFSNLLCKVFGSEILPSPPEIDRAHRSLAPKPAQGERPRPVILRLHRYQTKELLIREARRRGKLEFQGHSIRILEDYSPEVLNRRAEYKDVMATLYKRGLKPALLFPARLRLTLPDGGRKWISSVVEARKYIDSLPKSPTS